MNHRGDGVDPETDTKDGEVLADLFDTFLQAILDGRQPDLDAHRRERPDLQDRIQKTWALACSVAGRREPSRPVLGGYEILRELGHGGMGTVYLACHQALQREVAIKVLPHSLAMSPRAKQRFLEEARALARFRHDHVVHVHRILDHADMLAFEMEYIDGPSLRSLILALRQKQKPQAIASLAEVLGLPTEALGTRNTVEWFVRMGIKIARALADVHRHGLVHRDIKPSNILLRTNGQPVLADFGLAREEDLDTSHTSFAGTPVYAAPERLRSGDADVDARADVYSLGVTLYEALSLDSPFGGKTTNEVLRRIEEGRLPSLRKRAPHVSHDLEVVIGKAMERERRHRYATADEFADDLERLLSLQPIKARPAGPLRSAWKFVRRHQKVAMAAAGGAVLVTAIALPVAAHARGIVAAAALADSERHEARSRLLCPENLYSSWSPARRGAQQQTLRMTSVRDAQLAELERALASYDRALTATPDDAALVLEHAVVHTVTQLLRDEADTRTGPALGGGDTAAMPPLTGILMQQVVAGTDRKIDFHSLLATATQPDLFAAGLFAFLRNDHDTSEICWRRIDAGGPERPFVDACLALQMFEQGGHERAYPRLFHAVRAFPKATALAFAMAEAAIFTNDLALAEQWLAAIPETKGSNIARAQRKRLETDMLAAQGDYEAARKGYAELRSTDSTDPEPLLRMASLALRRGSLREAEAIYREVLRRWPDLAPPRLQLARLALQRHDLPGYLHIARDVMEADLGRMASPTAAQLADVLRLGGLATLHLELCQLLGRGPGALRSNDATPLTSWLRPSQVAGIAEALRMLRVFDRNFARATQVDPRPVGATIRAVWHTLADLPQLAAVVTPPVYAAVLLALPGHVEQATRWLDPILLPYQQSLGNRMVPVGVRRLFSNSLTGFSYFYGYQVQRVGDLDGDTLDEICITAPPLGGAKGGYLELRNLGDGALLRVWEGGDESRAFARAVTALDDVDGDLCNDLLISTPMRDPGMGQRSVVSLRSGRSGDEIWAIEDDTASFGTALANLGDLDGDGTSDFVVGIPPMSLDAHDRGRAIVYSGRSGHPLYEVIAERGGVWFGAAVANAGDTNGDGINDLIVGGNFGHAPGVVSLFDGRNGSLLSTFGEEDPDADFGMQVVGLGDVDGDGHADIAIGAPAISGGGREPGQVHVLSGRTGRSIYQLRGDRGGDCFGAVLCPMPWYRKTTEPALAVGARRGGPIGNGYVRVFSAADGQPKQTSAGTGMRMFAYSLVDLGDLDGDGFRDLGVSTVGPAGYALWVIHYGQTPPDQRDH
jgi:serine/threonine protein kinase